MVRRSPHVRFSFFGALGGLLVILMLLVACQPATPQPAPTTAPPTQAPTSAPSPTPVPPTPAPTETPSEKAFTPVSDDLCAQVQGEVEQALGVSATRQVVPFSDPITGEEGTACAIEVHGTGKDFTSHTDVIAALSNIFTQMGWKEDVNYQADGPTGAATAFREMEKAAFLLAQWKPSEDAKCPEDKPISQCDLKPEQMLYTITVHLIQSKGPQPIGMANPASKYCVEQGGKLDIRKDAQGNEYGVCMFPDGTECEEWAFFRGQCKPGEQAHIGMPDPAAVHCLKEGGKLDIRKDAQGNEYGVCVFPDGTECEEWAFFRGQCKPGEQAHVGMPDPAAQYCVEHGGKLEVRKDSQGNEYGVCVFPDGSVCEEWAFYRGECKPGERTTVPERIVFAPGATSASLEGEVPDQGKAEYVIKVLEGQLLILNLTTARDDIFLGVTTDDGYPLVRPVAEAQHWMGIVPKLGDYYIEVVAMNKGAPFSLFVQVPRWLTFPKGSNTTSVEGEIHPRQMVDYLLEAKEGQRLKVKVESPNEDVLLNIVALENGMPILRYGAEATEFDDVLPYTDRYLISVFGGSPNDTTYTLTVTLEGAGETGETYDDPFAYCQAVGTIDAPDARYAGPEVPAVIVKAIREAAEIAESAPDDWVAQGTVWRCMDGQVWGCFRGANISCMAKANTDKTPSEEMEAYCKKHPDSELIPASVTGRETVYEWRCSGEKPEPVRQIFHPDKQGFISEFWYKLTP